jgi:uncharacterized delta-60 repeat protein
LVRTDANGVPDPTFDDDGIVNLPFYGFGPDRISAVALDTSDPFQVKIVVAGTAKTESGSFDFALMRFRPDGSRDTLFQGPNNEPGEASFSLPGKIQVHGVDVDHLGRIVVVGVSLPTMNDARFVVARLTSSGLLDPTFDPIEQDGIVTFQAAGKNANVARSVDAFLDQNNQSRILVSGWVGDNMMGPKDFAVFQMQDNGRLDEDFGASGMRIVDASGSSLHDQAWGMIRQPNGSIILAGMAGGVVVDAGPSDFVLVRYLPNAQGGVDGRDPNFGLRGIVTHHHRQIDEGRSVALQSDGTIALAGFTSHAEEPFSMYVGRFTGNGVFRDEIISQFPYRTGHADQAWGVLVDAQDRIVAGGFHTHAFLDPAGMPVSTIEPAFAAIRLCDTSCPGGLAAGTGNASALKGDQQVSAAILFVSPAVADSNLTSRPAGPPIVGDDDVTGPELSVAGCSDLPARITCLPPRQPQADSDPDLPALDAVFTDPFG